MYLQNYKNCCVINSVNEIKIGSYGKEACLKRKLSKIDYCKLGQIFQISANIVIYYS